MTTLLSGALIVPAACTVRFTVAPGGVPTHVDVPLAAGTVLASHTVLVAALNEILTGWTVELVRQSNGSAKTRITSPGGALVTVAWSHAGDGSAVRDWLGFAGNLSGASSPATSTNACQALWWPETAAQVLRRSEVTRPRSGMVTLSGASRTQHDSSTGDTDAATWEVKLWAGPTSPYLELGQFETFLEDVEDLACEELVSVVHDGTGILGAILDDDLTARSVQNGWDHLWGVGFRLQEVSP